VLCLLLAACSKSKSFDEHEPLHEKLTGSVTEGVQAVHAGDFAENCDVQFADRQLEIAKQLDVRARDIQRIATAPPAVRRVEVGNTFFTEHDHQPGENKWIRNTKGWQAIFTRYEAIKNQPTNTLWVNFDSVVRGIVVDDMNRAVRGVDSGLDHLAGPLLKQFREILAICQSEGCPNVQLPVEIQDLVQRNRHLRQHWAAYQNARSKREAQDTFAALFERVLANQRRYEFYHNELIRRDGEGNLILPLNSGELAGAESQLTEFIESVWMSSGQRLIIEWNTSSLETLFKFLMDLQHPYSRAFVNWGNRVVQLYPGTNTRAIAHEIGHVLGFRDTYFTLWNENTCQYAIEQNQGDIMSSSQNGEVTAEEWEILSSKY